MDIPAFAESGASDVVTATDTTDWTATDDRGPVHRIEAAHQLTSAYSATSPTRSTGSWTAPAAVSTHELLRRSSAIRRVGTRRRNGFGRISRSMPTMKFPRLIPDTFQSVVLSLLAVVENETQRLTRAPHLQEPSTGAVTVCRLASAAL